MGMMEALWEYQMTARDSGTSTNVNDLEQQHSCQHGGKLWRTKHIQTHRLLFTPQVYRENRWKRENGQVNSCAHRRRLFDAVTTYVVSWASPTPCTHPGSWAGPERKTVKQEKNPTNSENWESCNPVTPEWQTKTWRQVHAEVHLPPAPGGLVSPTPTAGLSRGEGQNGARSSTELPIPRQDVFYSPGYGAKAKLWSEAPRFQSQVLLLTLLVCGQMT